MRCDAIGALNLRDLDAEALAVAVARFGVGPDLARRIFARVHRDGAADLDGVRGLGRRTADALAAAVIWPELGLVERRRAEDGFVKYLFRLHDGAEVEAVRIPLPDPEAVAELRGRRRAGLAGALEPLPTAKYTVCVSSQAGCALACDFCATGRLGAIRSLAAWEILAQVRQVAAEADRPVRGVVFMGMGEPLLNYENVMRAAGILCSPAGPAIPARAITISTAGVVPAIRRFAAEGHRFRLVFSLGAPRPEERLRLMPIEGRWPLRELMAAIRSYAATTTQRVTVAYVVIGGPDGNTSPRHARELGELLGGLKARVNLIDVTDSTGRYRRPSPDELAAFRAALAPFGLPVVRRYSGGESIGAACGTLSGTRVEESRRSKKLEAPPRWSPGSGP